MTCHLELIGVLQKRGGRDRKKVWRAKNQHRRCRHDSYLVSRRKLFLSRYGVSGRLLRSNTFLSFKFHVKTTLCLDLFWGFCPPSAHQVFLRLCYCKEQEDLASFCFHPLSILGCKNILLRFFKCTQNMLQIHVLKHNFS